MTAIILFARLLSLCAAAWPLRPFGLIGMPDSCHAALPLGLFAPLGLIGMPNSCHSALPLGLFAPSGLIGAPDRPTGHRLPLVERTPAIRGLSRVASASARPTALNAASAMWWRFWP